LVSVTAVDASHIEAVFDEDVDRPTAEFPGNYHIIERTVAVSSPFAIPGDTLPASSVALGADNRTVTITTQNPTGNLPYELFVTGVKDVSGNTIAGSNSRTFTGSNAADTTPPTITSRTPGPGATNVAVAQPIIITFSEAMNISSVVSAFSCTYSGGTVQLDADWDNSNQFLFTPVQPFAMGTTYTASLAATAQDLAGNPVTATNWTFTTASAPDNTPPTLLASSPVDGATNVPTNSTLSLTFSEPINQAQLDIFLTPDPGDGVVSFTGGGAILHFDPEFDLADDTQYNLLIPPGGIRDLAGNGNEVPYNVTFTTGASLATGSITGTIAGDPGTPAADPAGALVAALQRPDFEDPIIAGQTIAGAGGAYAIVNLPDGWYWLFSLMDSNGDGEIDPGRGDAFGAYGITDPLSPSAEPDSVEITGGGAEPNVDFQLFDFSAISGAIIYDGTAFDPTAAIWYMAVFDTTGFDVTADPPSVAETAGSLPFDNFYVVGEMNGLTDGTFYVGAFLDVDFDQIYDPNEPAGLYGGFETPTPITIANGSDGVNIDIVMEDPPSPTMKSWRVNPARPERSPEIENLYRVMQRLIDRIEK
jgi:hypothetical protein